ncbi:MAG TPA: hypothetical protein VGK73_08705 [Polyangiaceae bacterium]
MPEPEGLGTFALGLVAAGMWGFSEDEDTTEAEGVRYIDPLTRDYAVSGDEILKTTPTRQRVMNLLQNAFGSSMSMRGIKMPQVHGPQTGKHMDGEVRAVLKPLVDEGTITVDRVDSTTMLQGVPGRLGVSVEYTETLTGERRTVEV